MLVRAYGRILSASTVADQLLVELYDRRRIVAVTAYSLEQSPAAHRFAGLPSIDRFDDLEAVLALRPDLIVVNDYGDPARIARARSAGLRVFDLGPMHGVETFLEDARQLTRLLGVPERGERYARRFARRIAQVAAGRAPEDRLGGLYLTVYGDRIFGGTVGSSYHDILRYGGLRDVAAGAHRGWPEYGLEELLSLDPDLIVTKPAMGRRLCARPGLHRLRSCGGAGRILELDAVLLDATGPGMLEAAEAVFDGAYGEGR
ncbi:MAG: ABC transporter substrate-binding protein [Sandaracinaceae bacterium]